ncbi:hypothetical protein PsalMR5_01672 [Piscirickettsia salmonis]|uniref:hypothetical protein n=1 Tax=Piscirickettsia salmonis TaxID=1238 RepID=UPI0012BABB77|nr:hypothetical protein [Piscirickettsia salmonis]QGP54231.1 hypothetical protein PsalSR1_01663 [Piscirickettsia salmonis]QGP59870.1 hypothetical protein PsalBI1_02467 [Piscirickettsia salmonis]QGP63808.1 hypothetical protein PsalMR5_01672 [Piscirickettsia salmonis]
MKDLDLKSSFLSTLAAMEQLLEDKTLQSKEIMEEQDRRSRKVKKEQDKIKKREQRAQARGEQKRKPRLRIINFEEPGLEGSKLIDSLPGTDTAISTSQGSILEDSASQGSIFEGSASQGSAFEDSASQGSASQDSAAQDSAAQGSASQDSTSKDSVPLPLVKPPSFKLPILKLRVPIPEAPKNNDARLNLKEYAASTGKYQAEFQEKSAASKQKLVDLLQQYETRYNSNFVDYLGDLLKIKSDLIIPFLKKLNAFIEDTKGSRSDAIQFLLDTQHLADMFPSQRETALFEVVCEFVFDIKSVELNEFIQALYERIPDSKPGEVDNFKLQALREISDQLGLNVIVPSGKAYLKGRQQVEKNLASNKEKLQETECLRDDLRKRKSQAVIKQHEVLNKIVGLYVRGSEQDKLKPHGRKYFDRLFAPYFKFHNGHPQLSVEYMGNRFDFQAILKGIVENCKEKRTVWAVMGRQLQAGQTAKLLLEEASRYAAETGLRNIEGDVRRRIPFASNWDSYYGAPSAQETKIQSLNGNIAEVEGKIACLDKEKRELISAVREDINKAGAHVKPLIEELIERKRQEEERRRLEEERKEAERKQAELAERQKLAECKDLLPEAVIQDLEGLVTPIVSMSAEQQILINSTNLKLVMQCISDIQGQSNEVFKALHYWLAKNYDFLKKPENNPVTDRSTTMSGQKEACSGEWGVIELTLAKCMFANTEKGSMLASIPELIVQNPFLKLYGHLQPIVEGGAGADAVDGAGASAAGIRPEENIGRDPQVAMITSRLISEIDTGLGRDKKSKKSDLELIQAQVQSVSDNRVLEELFIWLMTQRYLWKTTGFSFTNTTMFGKERYCRRTWGKIEECFAKKMTINSCQAALHGERGAKGIDELIKGNFFLNKHCSLIKKTQKNFDLEVMEPEEAEGRLFERQRSAEASNTEPSLDGSYASM